MCSVQVGESRTPAGSCDEDIRAQNVCACTYVCLFYKIYSRTTKYSLKGICWFCRVLATFQLALKKLMSLGSLICKHGWYAPSWKVPLGSLACSPLLLQAGEVFGASRALQGPWEVTGVQSLGFSAGLWLWKLLELSVLWVVFGNEIGVQTLKGTSWFRNFLLWKQLGVHWGKNDFSCSI